MLRLIASMNPSKWSLPVRLAVMMALALLPGMILITAFEQEAIAERREAELGHTRITAQNAALVVDRFLRDLEVTTAAIAIPLADPAARLEQASLGPLLAPVARDLGVLRSLFVTDHAGRVVAASTGEGIGTDLSSRPYVQRVQRGESVVWTGSLSGPQSGRTVVVHSRRIAAIDGSLRGMVIAAFYPDDLLASLRLQLPAAGRIHVIDDRGAIVYSTIDIDPSRADVSAHPAVARALAGGEVTLRGEAGLIQSEPIYGTLVPIQRTKWTLAVLRLQAELDALVVGRALESVLVTIAIVLAGALLAAIVALSIARPLRQLARQAQQMAKGHPAIVVVRGGGPEIQELAATMRVMQRAIMRRTEQLRLAVSTREDFIRATAHDVRTPLTVLTSAAELLARRLERGEVADPASLRANVERIRHAVRRVNAHITQLADLSDLRSGQPLRLERRPTDLLALVRHVVEDLRDDASDRSLTLECDAVSEVFGHWDPHRLERAIQNLVGNALKFSPPGSTVEVAVGLESSNAFVRVRDRGIGIPADELARVREPFARGSNVAEVPGSGLGLAIVHEVASSHGGALHIDSVAGSGTTAMLMLPVTVSDPGQGPDPGQDGRAMQAMGHAQAAAGQEEPLATRGR